MCILITVENEKPTAIPSLIVQEIFNWEYFKITVVLKSVIKMYI